MDAIIYLQASYAHLYSCPYSDDICFMYDLDLCIVYLDSWLVESLWLLYILLWVSSWTCVTVATLILPASRACCDMHEALGGMFPKWHHVDCGVIAIICKVPVLGHRSTNLRFLMWYQTLRLKHPCCDFFVPHVTGFSTFSSQRNSKPGNFPMWIPPFIHVVQGVQLTRYLAPRRGDQKSMKSH
jgi:hypothetical protein